jgi:F0F1-type ATP synthase assembly protein I
MTSPEKNHTRGLMAATATALNMGAAVGVPVFLGILAGVYLDKRFGGHGLILSGMLILGVVVGLYGAIRALTKDVPWKR